MGNLKNQRLSESQQLIVAAQLNENASVGHPRGREASSQRVQMASAHHHGNRKGVKLGMSKKTT